MVINSCRLCLKFYPSSQVVASDTRIGKREVATLIQDFLGVSLQEADILLKKRLMD